MSKLLAESKKYIDEVRKLGNESKGEEVEIPKERYKRILMKGIKGNPLSIMSESQKGKRGRPGQVKRRIYLTDS